MAISGDFSVATDKTSEETDPHIPTIPFEALHKPLTGFSATAPLRAFDLLCAASIGRMMELDVSGLAHDQDADGALSPLPMMRSPSPCPRTARSCASGDRSEIMTTSAARPRTAALPLTAVAWFLPNAGTSQALF